MATLPTRRFLDIIQALQNGDAQYGMLPVENSLAGTVLSAYDLLVDYDLHIQAEVILRVQHCLMAPQGTVLADLARVISHQQALSQCEQTLRRLELEPVAHYDTAGAARDLAADPQPGLGAIASELAAETYGLEILSRHMEDEDFNFTRFFVLGTTPPSRGERSKTSIILTTRHVPGALYEAMGELARRGHQPDQDRVPPPPQPAVALPVLHRLRRPRRRPGRAAALLGILKHASFLKVLGSYPPAEQP